MSTNPLDRLTEGRHLPEGCDTWGIKSVNPGLRTSHDFQWPTSGWVAVDPEGIDQENTSPYPSRQGDGVCVASAWKGMASDGIPAVLLLLVAYSRADVLGEGLHKTRVSRACVVEALDGASVLAPGDDLSGADLAYADLTGANLTGANLAHADLTGANLSGVNLYGANLYGANLTDVKLTYANLTDVNLTGADLTGANMTDADLTDADLTDADLTDADLTDADLTGANLRRADLTDADLTDAKPSIGGNVEEKQCESSDCPVVLYTGEECPACGR